MKKIMKTNRAAYGEPKSWDDILKFEKTLSRDLDKVDYRVFECFKLQASTCCIDLDILATDENQELTVDRNHA